MVQYGTEGGDGLSFIVDPNSAENIDLHGVGDLLTHVTTTDQERDAAWALLRRHGALDLCEMLGVDR